MTRLGRLIAVALLMQIAPTVPAHASDTATCPITITLSFSSPGVGSTNASRTLRVVGSSLLGATCGGTSVWPAFGGFVGGPSASTSMNCGDIVAGSIGNVTYDGMFPAGMNWTYVGTVAGGTVVIEPNTATVVGVAVGAEVGTSLVNCEESGASITNVTLTGAMTFVRV